MDFSNSHRTLGTRGVYEDSEDLITERGGHVRYLILRQNTNKLGVENKKEKRAVNMPLEESHYSEYIKVRKVSGWDS